MAKAELDVLSRQGAELEEEEEPAGASHVVVVAVDVTVARRIDVGNAIVASATSPTWRVGVTYETETASSRVLIEPRVLAQSRVGSAAQIPPAQRWTRQRYAVCDGGAKAVANVRLPFAIGRIAAKDELKLDAGVAPMHVGSEETVAATSMDASAYPEAIPSSVT